MAMATIAGKEVHVNEEGFLTEYDEWSVVDPDLHHLDQDARRRVLEALPRIAAAISTTSPRAAVMTPVPRPAATKKEN